jgi:putative hydrolase of the HAD superfamily
MSGIQAVVFDLDDTLFPEREYAWSGFRAVAAAFKKELNHPDDTVGDLQRLFDSEHRARVFDALLKERFGEVDQSLVTRMVEVYRQHPPVITPYADVDSALTRLRARCKLGLITDGRTETQWAKIDALQFRPRFDCIIVTSDLKSRLLEASASQTESFSKPHPLAFEEMAQQLDVSPDACVYVADNVTKDFVAPNALGWLTIRVMRPDGVYCDAVCAEQGEARHTIKSLDELAALLA